MSSQRPSRIVSNTVNSAQMRPPPRKLNPPLNWSLNWKSRFVSSTITTPWKSTTFSTILKRRQLPTCPSTMTLQRLSSSNSRHRCCPRTMTMTMTTKSFQWSHRGRNLRCFPSYSSSRHSKRIAILLLLTRLWRWMIEYAISTRIVLNKGLSLAISTIIDREINEL